MTAAAEPLRRLAWGMLGASLVLILLALALQIVNRDLPPAAVWGFRGVGILWALSFAPVGAVIAVHRSRNAVGWLLLTSGLLFAVQSAAGEYWVAAHAGRPFALPGQIAALLLNANIWLPALALFGAVFLLFPDGRLPSRHWRLLIYVLAGSTLAELAVSLLAPGLIEGTGDVGGAGGSNNPLGIAGARGLLNGIEQVTWSLLSLALVACLFSVVVRIRGSRGVTREQLKWIGYAAAITAGVGLFSLPALYFVGQWGQRLVAVILIVCIGLVPASAGVAIFRYRLYEIDRIINRTLVYAVLTAVLAGLYVGLVLGLGAVARGLGGSSDTPLVVAASTLGAAALFRPVRRRVQALIDRRFYRKRYDAARTLEAFNARLRDQVDLDALSGELLGVVRESIQPASAGLWLRTAAKL